MVETQLSGSYAFSGSAQSFVGEHGVRMFND